MRKLYDDFHKQISLFSQCQIDEKGRLTKAKKETVQVQHKLPQSFLNNINFIRAHMERHIQKQLVLRQQQVKRTLTEEDNKQIVNKYRIDENGQYSVQQLTSFVIRCFDDTVTDVKEFMKKKLTFFGPLAEILQLPQGTVITQGQVKMEVKYLLNHNTHEFLKNSIPLVQLPQYVHEVLGKIGVPKNRLFNYDYILSKLRSYMAAECLLDKEETVVVDGKQRRLKFRVNDVIYKLFVHEGDIQLEQHINEGTIQTKLKQLFLSTGKVLIGGKEKVKKTVQGPIKLEEIPIDKIQREIDAFAGQFSAGNDTLTPFKW